MNWTELGIQLWALAERYMPGIAVGCFALWKAGRVDKSNQLQVNQLQTALLIQSGETTNNRQLIDKLSQEVARLSAELAVAERENQHKSLLIQELSIKLGIAQADLARALEVQKGINAGFSEHTIQQEVPGAAVRDSDPGVVLREGPPGQL